MVFALFLGVACGFTGLVTDVGFALRDRTNLQSGVDAAALAGASALPNQQKAISIATDYAAKNSLSSSDVQLTINSPYNNDPTKIEVIATTTQSTYFSSVLGVNLFSVTARSVGTMTARGGQSAAMLALNPTLCNSFNKVGSSSITINNGGGIAVNSSCNPSIRVNGSGTVTAAVIDYYYLGGINQSASQLNPTPTAVQAPIADPLASVTPPNLSTTAVSPDSGGTALNPAMKTVSSGTVTLHSGIFYGGLTVKNSANVTLMPGIYVMAGGGFVVQGGPTISGTQVMIYSTFDPQKNSGAGACGAIDLSGSGTWSYSPPTLGTYKGIGLWQDKACTNDVKLNGSNGGPSGAIYAPSAKINAAGSGALGSVQLIADSFDVAGSGTMSVNFVPWISIPLQPTVKLVE